ncbi:hypothetical protein [Actinospongicola halichondriae]|uniref:hypothetical protein n=1 Tax=Actinospongicola halichondriae TaxID=3236844 RepID=UPI003D3C1F93
MNNLDDAVTTSRSVGRWTTGGATIGAVAVMTMTCLSIALTDAPVEILAVGSLGAGFGGVGLGGMLGAVLASVPSD